MTPNTRPAGPGPLPEVLRPSTAERARTVAARPAAAVCAAGIDGSRVLAHAVTAARDVLLVVPADGEVAGAVGASADGDLASLLLVTDHAPVPLRDPVRAQVWLSGWLSTVGRAEQRGLALAFADVAPVAALLDLGRTTTMLRLDLAEVVLKEGDGVAEVDPDAFLAAAPDPLAGVEAAALRHLDECHPAELALLGSRVPAELLRTGDALRPLGLDRCGFRLRIEQAGSSRDLRVPFAAPVTSADELGPAVHQVLCAARAACPGR